MTGVAPSAEEEPYDVVVPYSTWEVAVSLVLQVITAEVDAMLLAAILERVGAVVSGARRW